MPVTAAMNHIGTNAAGPLRFHNDCTENPSLRHHVSAGAIKFSASPTQCLNPKVGQSAGSAAVSCVLS